MLFLKLVREKTCNLKIAQGMEKVREREREREREGKGESIQVCQSLLMMLCNINMFIIKLQ